MDISDIGAAVGTAITGAATGGIVPLVGALLGGVARFGQAILEAVASRGSYRLEKHHNPAVDEVLTFDFSACGDSLEEKILALISVEKVFRLYRDPSATAKDNVIVDHKIDEFLMKHFDQYRLYCSSKDPHIDNENPGYIDYHGLREDAQYDDLTFLAIRRK